MASKLVKEFVRLNDILLFYYFFLYQYFMPHAYQGVEVEEENLVDIIEFGYCHINIVQ